MVSTGQTRPGPSSPSRGQRLAPGRRGGVGVGDPSCGLGLHVLCGIELSGTESALFIGRALYRHAPPSSPNWAAQRWILTGGYYRVRISADKSQRHSSPDGEGHAPSTTATRVFLQFLRAETVSGLLAPPLDAAENCSPVFKSTDCLSCFPKRYKNTKCLYQTNRKCTQYYNLLFKALHIVCPVIKNVLK